MNSGLVPASEYTTDDLINTLRVLPPWWFCLTEHLLDPLGDPTLSALVAQQQRALHDVARACELPKELFSVNIDGEHELSLGAALLRKRVDDQKHRALDDCINMSMDLLHQAAARVREIRRPPTVITGAIGGLFTSGGGVPKLPIASADVQSRGFVGDKQATRKHHGRPWQALCLWSAEVVERLANEGHPIHPGNAGENISITSLNWAEVLPGSQLEIGSMVCEVTVYALPCTKNARWFLGRDFERMHHRRETGISRMYANVITPGRVAVGDAVRLS
jgi:MOSC domain-containing protein YiiM